MTSEQEFEEFPRCAVDGCERSVSCPPHRDADGRGICKRCAVAAAGGRCAYCRRELDRKGYEAGLGAYTLDDWGEGDFRSKYSGKPLCMLCWTGLGYAHAGYTADDPSERGAAEDRGPVMTWPVGD